MSRAKLWFGRLRPLSLAVFAAVAVASGAEAGTATAPKRLTTAPDGAADVNFETIATKSGFLVAWDRLTGASVQLLVQRFKADGTPIGDPVSPAATQSGFARPEFVPLDGGGIGMVWYTGAQLLGATVDGGTGKIGKPQTIVAERNTNNIHDVAALANGDVALITRRDTAFNDEDTTLAILDGSLKPKGAARVIEEDVPGPGYVASSEQTIVSTGKGGTAIFRASDGQLRALPFDASGKPAKAFQLNTTPMVANLTVFTLINFAVKAEPLPGGGYVVVWTTLDEGSGANFNLRGRVVDSSGKPIGKDFAVNLDEIGNQAVPEILVLDKGFGVAWTDARGFSYKHVARFFDKDGAPLTDDVPTEYFGPDGRGIATPGTDAEYARLASGASAKIFTDGSPFGGASSLFLDIVPAPRFGTPKGDDLEGKATDDFLATLAGSDKVALGDGDDTVDTGADVDTVDGGPGEDWIVSGEGDDDLTGGDGPDTFVFRPGGGKDVVEDFAKIDRIDVSAFHYNNKTEMRGNAAQIGKDVVITLRNPADPAGKTNIVRLRKFKLEDLTDANIIL